MKSGLIRAAHPKQAAGATIGYALGCSMEITGDESRQREL